MESGIPISYFGSLISKGIETPWEGVWRIQCEEGAIHLENLVQGYGVYSVNAAQELTKMVSHQETPDGIHGVLADWAISIREDRSPVISGEDNIKTLTALLATSDSSLSYYRSLHSLGLIAGIVEPTTNLSTYKM
jgi:predicted dehydrogenase